MTEQNIGTVLVTGGASGLGVAVVQAVQEAGGRAVVLDRVEPSSGAPHRVVDLADARAAEEAVRAVAEEEGGIDAVVTCAGTDACGQLADVPAETWERSSR